MTETKTDEEIAQAYVRYHSGIGNGNDNPDYWAIEELQDLVIDAPLRTWNIIQLINAIPIKNDDWRAILHGIIGCGELETIIALHADVVLPKILEAAANDVTLRAELSVIYETSLDYDVWIKIQAVLMRVP